MNSSQGLRRPRTVVDRSTRDLIHHAAVMIDILDQMAEGKLPMAVEDVRTVQRLERPLERLFRSVRSVVQTERRAESVKRAAQEIAGGRTAELSEQCARSMVEALSGDASVEKEEEDDRCTIQGTSSSMPLGTVLEFLSRTRRTGRLVVTTAEEKLVFHFSRGQLVYTETDWVREKRLGDVLFELGYVDAENLQHFLERYRSATAPLGEVLMREGLVTREQLVEALELQVEQRFFRAFRTEEASYAFFEEDIRPPDDRIDMNVTELLFASARIHDEIEEARRE